MANKTLAIHVKVNNAASAPLDKVKQSMKDAGNAAKQTSADFTRFNQTLFTTSAYIGFFTLAYKKFGDQIAEGAKFDRLENQFERVMGPKGELFKQISDFTDNSIDKVEAMRSAIALKTLGIANDTGQVAELIARAGTAAKNAGLESGEGIKKFTQFLKDGSVSNLEFLNLMSSQNPAFKIQMALISKYGGVLGGAMTAQAKYAMGMRLLRLATQDTLKGQRDLYDVVLDSQQAFSFLGKEIGRFFGEALKNVIEKITKFTDLLSSTLEDIRNNKKEILFLTKSIVTMTSALAGLLAVGGTLRLLGKAFGALGITAFPIIGFVTTIATLFFGLTHNIKEGDTALQKFVNKLQGFAAVFQGIYQLVESFLTEPDNFAKGIGKMDKALYEFLDQKGLFKFVYNVSKVIAIIGKFGSETFKTLISWAKQLDELFSNLSNKFLEFFGLNEKLNINLKATGNVVDEPAVKRSSSIWVDASKTFYKYLTKGAAALTVAFGIAKVLGLGKGFLTNLPIIGKFFGKATGDDRPKGTASDPIYTQSTGISAATSAISGGGIGGAAGRIISSLGNFIRPLLTAAILEISVAFSGGLSGVIGLLGRLSGVLFIAYAAFNFVAGVAKNLGEVFTSFIDMSKSIFGLIENYDYNTLFNNVSDMFNNITSFITKAFLGMIDELKAKFPILSAVIESVTTPLKLLVDWSFKLIDAFSKFYEWIKSIPGVGSLLSAAEDAGKQVINGEAYKGLGNMATGALIMGQEAVSETTKNATAGQILSKAHTGQFDEIKVPESQGDRYDLIQRAIAQVTGAEQNQMASSLREAMKDGVITPEEFKAIFGAALDESKLAKFAEKTEVNTKPDKTKTLVSKRC